MNILTIPSNLLESNMYVVVENGHALIIDPWVSDLPDSFADVKIDKIFVTHEHIDHISGVNYWKEKSGAPFICTERCAEGCKNPRKNLSAYIEPFWALQTWVVGSPVPQIGEYVALANQVFDGCYEEMWNEHKISIFECSGHSKGSCIIIIDSEYLFSGDSLLRDFPTTTNIPGGSKKEWIKNSEGILKKINNMSNDIIVYPGHFECFPLSSYQFWSEKGE